MSGFDLLVLGDINPDVVVSGVGEPVFGQAETLVEDARSVVGGSGAIMACAAAKLGLRTAIVGVVGDDAAGRMLLSALSESGVEVGGCIVDPSISTGMSVILSRGDDRAILTARGTTAALRAEDIDPTLLASARHVHASHFFLQEALAPDLPAIFERARDAGASTSVDPNWDPAATWDGGLREVLEQTSCLFVNETEARRISGAPDAEAAAKLLSAAGSVADNLVVVKLGRDGALARRGEELVRQQAQRSSIVDTTGAGDTFDAGFLAGYLQGWPLERCLALAVTCGSLSTRALGGTEAQPSLEEALAEVEKLG